MLVALPAAVIKGQIGIEGWSTCDHKGFTLIKL